MTRLEACLLLRLIPGIGNIRSRKLVEHFKSPEAIFEGDADRVLTIDGIGTVQLTSIKNWKPFLPRVNKEVGFIEKNRIRCFFFGDPDYPETLAFCPDAPLVLFYKGTIDFTKKKIISVVGTRQNTAYGKDFCESFIEALKPINPIIVSGFAYGIDIIAHCAAIKHGMPTVGCLAHGFDRIYPLKHKKYIQEIENLGGFVTDFMEGEPFDRNNFPRRNRIIAGLGHVTVVIETANKGGSMNSADLAHQYGREIFALPGRVTDHKSQGCHRLILQHKAQLLNSPDQFLELMGWNDQGPAASIQKQLFIDLNEDEKKIYELLKSKEKESLDILAIEGQFTISKAATLLMQLEMKGCVRPLPGKYFEWI